MQFLMFAREQMENLLNGVERKFLSVNFRNFLLVNESLFLHRGNLGNFLTLKKCIFIEVFKGEVANMKILMWLASFEHRLDEN